jgi:cell division protein FtsW (lipid II flippase)
MVVVAGSELGVIWLVFLFFLFFFFFFFFSSIFSSASLERKGER